jgi:RND superfamily putative drug exporter
VFAVWLAIVAAGAVAATSLPARLVSSYSVPGTESDQAAVALARGFHERPEGTFTAVFPLRGRPESQLVQSLHIRLIRAARELPGGHVASFRAETGLVYGDLETTAGLQRAKQLTSTLRQSLRGAAPRALVTGEPAVQHDLEPQLETDLRRAEILAVPVVLLVLAFALGRSAALLVPLLFATATIGGTLALLSICARFVAITPYAVNLVELIGLGLAVDYSLLMMRRYLEELERGATRVDAAVYTMASAGRAVRVSATAVAIGLASLLFMPVPFLRTMGLAGLLIPIVSLATALTLHPVLMVWCGRAKGRPRSGWWKRFAVATLARPRLTVLASTAGLVTAALPVFFLQLTPASFAGLPQSLEASRGLAELRHAFGPGALTPTQIVIDGGRPGAALRPPVKAATARLSDNLVRDPEVYVVALGRGTPYVSADSRYARLFVVGRHEFSAPQSERLVARIREASVPNARFPNGTTVLMGGAAPQGADFLARTYGSFPWLVLAVLGLAYIVLARAFRSVLLPLQAVLLNLLSVAATYGLLVLVFNGTAIAAWVPVFLFAVMFGLSMDYEVFLVSRIREAHDEGRPTGEAVAHGLERTGSVITAAALVMVVSFGGFAVGSIPALQQFGVGLVLAVAIDASVVRALLAPSLMAIVGHWNWWAPASRARKRAAVLTSAVLLMLAAPTTAAASPTVRLAIAHVVQHCHVWRTPKRLLGPSTKLAVKPGTRLVIRADCPMDFDYAQTAGPRLALGNPRTFAGESRLIVFRKAGTYRLQVKNVQSPEDRGLVTLGETNTLRLTVVVK